MVIRISTITFFLWPIIVLITALAFPLQVYSGNPYPSLIPYILIVFIFLLSVFRFRKHGWPRNLFWPSNYIGLVVKVYIIMVFSQTIFQTLFGAISIYEAASTMTVYFLPVLFYCYFRELASEEEIKIVLKTIVVSSLIVGLYFAYDSYVKLSLHQVTDYALRAFEYSKQRAIDQSGDLNEARIALGYRSFGLLETHSVSGGWVVIGSIAWLSLIEKRKKILRLLIVFLYATLLLLGLNFTSIIAYFLIIFLFELGGVSIFRFRFSTKLITNIVITILLLMVLSSIPRILVGDVMADFIANNLIGQKQLAVGVKDNKELSMIGIVLNNFKGYFEHISKMPHALFFGDGFSSFGMNKGGDIGFVESMAKFGLPFFCVIIFGFSKLLLRSFSIIHEVGNSVIRNNEKSKNYLRFAISFTVLIFICDLHYSIWASKAILPLLFFVIALYDRYLNVAKRVLSN